MKGYEALKFKGTFRDYQQSVLDRMDAYLDNRRIHIVAAPGSGKTTLGIELIRRLGQPALILSPSLTIRNQWGDRIREGFLADGEDYRQYVSTSLKEPKLIISTTYQALHSAYRRLIDKGTGDEEEETEIVDYTRFDLIKTLKEAGIRTFCLDEAHHLRSEWYKSLTAVLDQFSEELSLIALTATPPYDSDPNEWERYVSLCGDIDEEIFVPQLISQNNLCPHQDFVYFNYPTDAEKDALRDYRIKAIAAVDTALNNPSFVEWVSGFLREYKAEKYQLFEYLEDYRTLVRSKKKDGMDIPFGLRRILAGEKKRLVPHFLAEHESLFNTILAHPEVFGEALVKELRHIFQENGLIEFGVIHLDMNSSLRRQLISSIGKIGSIGEIARFESQRMGNDLQMLVLTDFIKKELLPVIGPQEPLQVMGAVPIFEVIRRNIPVGIRLALLTGSLVILPADLEAALNKESEHYQTAFTLLPVNDTEYRIVRFSSDSKNTVKIITELFEKGRIDILVGTKSLLGEGWDSPCINTLIMASFVGSYMLSNQMRGRAIRIDRNHPQKVASIWHLATVEPHRVVTDRLFKYSAIDRAEEKDQIVSQDFAMLKRRFQTFLGPRYSDGSIESGIERLDFIKPPYSESRFREFNEKTFAVAANRDLVRDQWQTACPVGGRVGQIIDVGEVPAEVWPVGLFIFDATATALLSVVLSSLARVILDNFGHPWLIIPAVLISLFILFPFLKRILLNLNPPRAIKTVATSVFRTMMEVAMIQSKSALPVVKKDKRTGLIHAYLENATRHEKALFAGAMREMLSVIDNPRYIAVETRRIFGIKILFCSSAFSVPSLFSENARLVEAFTENLSAGRGKFVLFYTRSESGRRVLLRARRASFLSRFGVFTMGKRILKDGREK